MSVANPDHGVDRRIARRDRRLFGDRRSNVLPNITEFSRRVAIKDRRGGAEDRRVRDRAARVLPIVPSLVISR